MPLGCYNANCTDAIITFRGTNRATRAVILVPLSAVGHSDEDVDPLALNVSSAQIPPAQSGPATRVR